MRPGARAVLNRELGVLLALALLLAFSTVQGLAASVVVAQSGDGPSAVHGAGYDLSWWTVDGGGYSFNTGGGYSLGGTAGQGDAGVLTDGDYTLGGGFWGGGALAVGHKLYLPLVLRGFP
jgi:hypothetical protein